MIHLENVSVQYSGGFFALHPTSIVFTPGQFTVLLGPSGAGKSTLLRCLNLLVSPIEGAVIVGGVGRLSNSNGIRRHRRQTAMIFQQHQLIGRRTALQNVLTGRLGYHSTWQSLFPFPEEEQALALHSLERVGLLQKALERVDRLSGGEQQRVGIARALVQQPQTILADEPVASLDPATANRVMSLLYQICKEDGITAVVSLHQVNYAKQYADRIIGLTAGRVVFDGRPQELTGPLLERIYNHGSAPGRARESEFEGFPKAIAPLVSDSIIHDSVV